METDLCVHDVGHGDEGVPGARDERHPGIFAAAGFKHPDGDRQECEERQRLVGPCEVTPENVEAVRVALGDDENDSDERKNDSREGDALAHRFLVDVEGVSDGHTQCAQRCVARGDRQHDDTDQRDDAADVAEDIFADDTDGAGGQRRIRFLQAKVVRAHGASCPDHGDEAFEDHHVVESHAALAFALHRTADDRRLRGVEAGENTAGNSNEEDRNEVVGVKIIAVCEDRAIPVVPEIEQWKIFDKDPNEHADRREEQDRAEDWINAADDLVDREEGRDEIINEDNSVDDPRRYRCCCAVKTKDLCCRNIARCVDEHRANQKQQQAAEDLVDGVDAFVGIFADHFRHLCAAVAQADHAREIVVHRTADDVADRDRDERDRSEKDPLDRPQDRTGTGNVEQIDEAVFPAAHRYVVDAILLCVRRRLAIVRTEDVLAELSVDRSAYEKDHEPNDECSHK